MISSSFLFLKTIQGRFEHFVVFLIEAHLRLDQTLQRGSEAEKVGKQQTIIPERDSREYQVDFNV